MALYRRYQGDGEDHSGVVSAGEAKLLLACCRAERFRSG